MKIGIVLVIAIGIFSKLMAADWSQYIATKRENDVTFSFRQLKENNSWTVEWKVDNGRKKWVEPVILKRSYTCNNNKIQEFGEISFGSFPPLMKNSSELRDKNICLNAQLVEVNIKTEIRSID